MASYAREMGRHDEDQSALRLAARGKAGLCTVVGIDGSFSRRLGAQLAVGWSGALSGSLADGCLERELANQATLARAAGKARLLRYGKDSPFLDFRLPCGSGLDILIDPYPDVTELAQAVANLDARRPASVLLNRLAADRMVRRGYVPPLRLLALGSGPELDELSRIAATFGAHFEAMTPGLGLSSRARPSTSVDAWTAIVLLFHDHEWEEELLEWALSTDAYYIGALGGEVARATRRDYLRTRGFETAAIARVRSPIGLIPRARDARVVALSVMAEVVSVYEATRV